MRIAVWHNLPSGGAKRALYDHVRGLTARGHVVEAWCPPSADLQFLPLAPMAREHLVPLEWDTPWRRTDDWAISFQIDRQMAAMAAHCRDCVAQIEAGGFDILFANSCRYTGAAPIGRFTKMPSVLYLQEPYRPLYEAQPRLRWLARPARKGSLFDLKALRATIADLRQTQISRIQAREELESAGAFTRILVNSYFSRESVLRAYGIDSDVCYLGIDTGHFIELGLQREDFVVGLGEIGRHKNPEFVVRAIGAMRGARPGLVWIGNKSDPELMRELTALAAELGVRFETRVRVSDQELVETLNRAQAIVYAPRLEPFGLAPLEANACGVPAVAVAEGGVRETILDGETGLLVESDPAAMAAALERLREDPALARRLGENARRNAVEKWGLGAATDRIEARLLRYAGKAAASAD